MIDKKIRYQEELEDIDCDVKVCRHKVQYCVSFNRLNMAIVKQMNVEGFVKFCSKHYNELVLGRLVEDKIIFLSEDGESFRCSRCGYEWMSYYIGNKMPRSCRKCRSVLWKAPYKRRDQVQIIRRLLEQQKGIKLENNK